MEAVRTMIIAASLMTIGGIELVSSSKTAYADNQLNGVTKGTVLIGMNVKNPEGKDLGKIKELVVNSRASGFIKYVVLSSGRVVGTEEQYFAVPWDVLILSGDNSHFVLNGRDAWLRNTPGFDKRDWPHLSQPAQPDVSVVVYDAYGLQPKAFSKVMPLSRSAHTSPVVRGETYSMQNMMVRPPS